MPSPAIRMSWKTASCWAFQYARIILHTWNQIALDTSVWHHFYTRRMEFDIIFIASVWSLTSFLYPSYSENRNVRRSLGRAEGKLTNCLQFFAFIVSSFATCTHLFIQLTWVISLVSTDCNPGLQLIPQVQCRDWCDLGYSVGTDVMFHWIPFEALSMQCDKIE